MLYRIIFNKVLNCVSSNKNIFTLVGLICGLLMFSYDLFASPDSNFPLFVGGIFIIVATISLIYDGWAGGNTSTES